MPLYNALIDALHFVLKPLLLYTTKINKFLVRRYGRQNETARRPRTKDA